MVVDGYKQTDVGVIPEDWKIKTLGQFGLFSKGRGVKKDEANSGELACVRYGELYTKHNDYVKKVYSFISQEIAQTAKKLKTGDILFAGSGETKEDIGKSVAFIGDYEAYAGGDIVILSPKNVDSLFLGYALNRPIISKQKASKGQGDAVVHISANSLGDVKIAIPNTKPEQQAIATTLSDTDELINSLEKLITKKEAIKTGTMQELLTGKKRLDGFSGEWEEKTLGDIVDVVSGGTPSSTVASYWNGTVDWYTPTEIGKDKYVSTSVRKITQDGFQNCSAKTLPIGTILFTSRAGIGDTSILTAVGCTNQGFQSLVAKKNIDNEFVYYLVSTLTNKFLQNASGSTFLEISPNKVKEIEIFIPQYKEQQAIATILSDIDRDIDTLKTKLSKVRAIKEGMMQELLTGRIRLKV